MNELYEAKEKLYKRAIADLSDLWLKLKSPDSEENMIVGIYALEKQIPKEVDFERGRNWCPACQNEVDEDRDTLTGLE